MKIARCPAIDPDCHAQEGIQKHQSCSKQFKQPRLPLFRFPCTWPPSQNAPPCYMGMFLCLLCSPFIFPSEICYGQGEEHPCSSLPRLLLNHDEAKSYKPFLLCVVKGDGHSVFSLRVSEDCGKPGNLSEWHWQVCPSLGKDEGLQMQSKERD